MVRPNSAATAKRTKERTIEEVIQKVNLWRRLYNGVIKDGVLQRQSLEVAAQKVGVSKKSLDDYLMMLRFGKKYNFDWQKHKQSKIGVLRAFVKQKKEQDKKTDKTGKYSSMIEVVEQRKKMAGGGGKTGTTKK